MKGQGTGCLIIAHCHHDRSGAPDPGKFRIVNNTPGNTGRADSPCLSGCRRAKITLRMCLMNPAAIAAFLIASCVSVASAQQSAANLKPGVPAVQAPFESLKRSATFKIGATADWVLVASDSIWVSGSKPYSVQRIDPATNRIAAKVRIPGEACAGLAFGFGSVWVPVCGKKPLLARVDVHTNRISALLPIAPAGPEGGITASDDSIWMVTNKDGTTLSRIDPATNVVRQKVSIPSGSYNPLSRDRTVWITSFEKDLLTAVDATNGNVLASIPVGPKPRFLAAGGGSVWTLNQGDGSLTRVEIGSRKVTNTVALGIPGFGGDLDYGAGFVWASMIDLPITMIDGRTDIVRRQWIGQGGDAVRFGFDSIWVTDYHRGLLWRIPAAVTLQP
jgi:virginiamycin B lyase